MRKFVLVAFLLFALPSFALATPVTCTVTGTVYKSNGSPAVNTNVEFRTNYSQTFGADTIAPTAFIATTDSNGNLPVGVQLPQSEHVNVTVGKDKPIVITVPNGASCPTTLGTMLALNQGALVYTLTSNVNAGGNRITNLGVNTTSGDALSQGQSHLNDLAAATGDYAMGSYKLTGLIAPTATGNALSEGAPIGAITPAAGSFTSLTGSGTNGPSLSNFNINGAYNVKAYGAVSSTVSVIATTTIGSSTVTLSAAGDFVNGQAIAIPHAGPTPSVATPTGLAVQSSKWSPPNTVAANGTGATNATYQVVAVDSSGGQSAPAAAVSIANSQAALTFDAFNQVSWTATTNAIAYLVYGCVGAACTPTLIGVVPSVQLSYLDMGNATHFGTDNVDGAGVPSGALNQWLYSTIATGGGTTTITLNATALVSVSFGMVHDNAPAFNAAVTASINGGQLYIPSGLYSIGQTIVVNKGTGLKMLGAGEGIASAGTATGTELVWNGPIGGTVLSVNATRESYFGYFDITREVGTRTTTPGRAVSIDNVNPIGSFGSTDDTFDHLYVDESGIGYELSDAGTQNNDLHRFTDDYCLNGGIACIWLNNAQSKFNNFDQFGFSVRLYDIYEASGSFTSYSCTFNSLIGVWLTQNTDVMSIVSPQVENAKRFLVTGGPSGAAYSVSVRSGRFSPYLVSADKNYLAYFLHGPLNLVGNEFADGEYNAAWQIDCANNAYGGSICLNSIGNSYPNGAPFAGVSGSNTYISFGDKQHTASAVVDLPPIVPFFESTAPTGSVGSDIVYGDSTAHRLKVNNNNGGALPLGLVIASGTSALNTATVVAGTCATLVQTAATGVVSTDAIIWDHNAAVTGGTNGSLIIHAYPTANNVNFQECNPTTANITPPADTLNWMVVR